MTDRDFNAEERNRWGGPSPFAGRDSRTDAQKQSDALKPLNWEWERVMQLAANALGTADAAQNESDSRAIARVYAWLRTEGLA